MSFSRFEAFSDGVFAIAATLLALEIRIPDLSNASPELIQKEFINLLPQIVIYITGFIVIGVIWLNHHALFHLLRRVDRISLTINLFLLMCIAFIPCSTAIIGQYNQYPIVVVFYGLSLAVTGFIYNVLWFYVLNRYIKREGLIHRNLLLQTSIWSISYPVSYLLSALLAFTNSRLSLVLYVLISLFYLAPGSIDRQLAHFCHDLEKRERINPH